MQTHSLGNKAHLHIAQMNIFPIFLSGYLDYLLSERLSLKEK